MSHNSPHDDAQKRRTRLRIGIITVLLGWTFAYNLLIKELSPARSFFQILDTISDDFVMGTLLTILIGVAIVAVFSFTKLYTQIISNIHSFRIIEDLVYGDLQHGYHKVFWHKLLTLQDQPTPDSRCPQRVTSMLFAFSVIYVMSWIYLVLFSEALFFVSWSAGVDLPITPNNLLLLPTLALAIPFSARVMAYMRYPYAQDYGDFMPGAVFVLLLVATLGYLFQSDDQKFFLVQVYNEKAHLHGLLKNGCFLAFIPVFFEGTFWLFELGREEDVEPEPEPADATEVA